MENQVQVQVIAGNVKKAITSARKRGTVSVSFDNLFQITSTKGVTCPVGLYRTLFIEAVRSLSERYRCFVRSY